jgi:hypothetical protein
MLLQISVCRSVYHTSCHPERVAERSESQIIMIAGGNHTLIEAQRSRRIYALTTCIADIRCEDPSTRLRLGRDDSVCGESKQPDKLEFERLPHVAAGVKFI